MENTATYSFNPDYSFICPDCKKRVEPIDFYDPFKEIMRKLPGTCPCQEARREAERRHWQEENRRNLLRSLRDAAQLGRYSEATLDTFRPRTGTEKALWECKRFVNEFPRNTGILLSGKYGNGKSHLAGAICNALIEQGHKCLFRNVLQLLNSIKATWDSESTDREWNLMHEFKTADLLVLDDLGAHKWSEWREDTLYTIIDSRYSLQNPVVVTTNCSLDELEERVGGRSFDRLKEMCLMIENTADSYREIIAMQRIQDRRKRA